MKLSCPATKGGGGVCERGKTCRGEIARFEKAKLARQSKLFISVLVFQEGKRLERIQIFPAGKNSC